MTIIKFYRIHSFVILLLLFLITVSTIFAQSGYEISWWTVDGGGGQSSGGNYILAGTVGQPDAGLMSGGNYTLTGGFWFADGVAGGPGSEYDVYLPLIIK